MSFCRSLYPSKPSLHGFYPSKPGLYGFYPSRPGLYGFKWCLTHRDVLTPPPELAGPVGTLTQHRLCVYNLCFSPPSPVFLQSQPKGMEGSGNSSSPVFLVGPWHLGLFLNIYFRQHPKHRANPGLALEPQRSGAWSHFWEVDSQRSLWRRCWVFRRTSGFSYWEMEHTKLLLDVL